MVVGVEAVGRHDMRQAVATPYLVEILGFVEKILEGIQQVDSS